MHIDLSKISEELVPRIEELPGDLAQLAGILDELFPGHGVRATLRISEEFRSTYIYCHNLDKLKCKIRDRWLSEQRAKGLRVSDLARQVGLSERRVWEILGVANATSSQRELLPGEERQMKMF